MKPTNRIAKRYPKLTSSARREQAIELAQLDYGYLDALCKVYGFRLATPPDWVQMYDDAARVLERCGMPMAEWGKFQVN